MPSIQTDPPFTEPQEEGQPSGLKPYAKPEILHDLELETRAGTPLSIFPDPLDPTGAGQ